MDGSPLSYLRACLPLKKRNKAANLKPAGQLAQLSLELASEARVAASDQQCVSCRRQGDSLKVLA